MEINRELSKRQFMQKENDYHHSPYETELEFYSAVRAGDLETVKRLYTPLDTNGKGRLSKDDLRNVKYHLVITIAMLCRFCIEGGSHRLLYKANEKGCVSERLLEAYPYVL